MTNDPSQDIEPAVRDRLALARTRLANERTMLAYSRTAIMLAATGAAVLQLHGQTLWAVAGGWALVACALCVGGVGAARFGKLARALQ